MKFISINTDLRRDELLAVLRNNDFVNNGVRFDEKLGKPLMHIKEKKNSSISITCELTGRPTKDDSFFILGTAFRGKIDETDSGTRFTGCIMTAPVYHLVWAALVLIFILQCINLKGFSPIPICLVVINFFMFGNEYKKQGLIERYIKRAVGRAERNR